MKLLCWDTETTGVDVFNDRIVTAFVGVLNEDGTWGDMLNVLINPGIDIPEGASAVHGITTEHARRYGVPPEEGISAIFGMLEQYYMLPNVVMNANYDFSILHEEMKRYGISGDPSYNAEIYDPLVMDRHFDKYRRGPRKLVNLARQYGVAVEEDKAHDAAYDCYLAGNVTRAILARYGGCTTDDQARWYEEWRSGFEAYLRRNDPSAVVEGGWPIRVKEDKND